jgi:hypothetical protein
MEWSKEQGRWIFPDSRTPEQKAKDKARAEDLHRKMEEHKKAYKPVSDRIATTWGKQVACGLGWKDLIFNLVERIDKVWEGFSSWKPHECWQLNQVKEKFGGLRFYVGIPMKKEDSDSEELVKDFEKRCDETYRLINNAEARSTKICEKCGQQGKALSVNGWLSTLCEACRKKQKVTL